MLCVLFVKVAKLWRDDEKNETATKAAKLEMKACLCYIII